jgi:hypothetical protein
VAPFRAGQGAAREQSTSKVRDSDSASWLMMRCGFVMV